MASSRLVAVFTAGREASSADPTRATRASGRLGLRWASGVSICAPRAKVTMPPRSSGPRASSAAVAKPIAPACTSAGMLAEVSMRKTVATPTTGAATVRPATARIVVTTMTNRTDSRPQVDPGSPVLARPLPVEAPVPTIDLPDPSGRDGFLGRAIHQNQGKTAKRSSHQGRANRTLDARACPHPRNSFTGAPRVRGSVRPTRRKCSLFVPATMDGALEHREEVAPCRKV